jgi:hypothetical protein
VTKPGIEVDLENLRRSLRGVDGGLSDLKATHKKAAEVVANDAKPRARRKTGRMADSIRAAGQARQGVVRAGFARLPYVPVHYFGWAKRGIQPSKFLDESIDNAEPVWIKIYEKDIDRLMKQNGL